MKTNLKKYLSVLFLTAFFIAVSSITMPITATPLSVSDNDVPVIESEYFTISGNTITVIAKDGTDITKAINESLDQATALAGPKNIYTVKVPAGSYKISSAIKVNSNTTLDLYDVSITSDPSASEFSMLIFGDYAYTSSSACAGYNGFKNITIKGGTFTAAPTHIPAPFLIMHADNVTLKDVTIGGGIADHLVESAAISNFMIDGCTFRNMSDSATTGNGTREALQLDLAVHDSIFPFCYLDGTMMKNVTVQNCTFDNVSRGLGTHSLLLNAYHENIKILNNTFKNVEEECIIAANYYNCEISGNKMTDCGGGIIFQYSKSKDKTIFTTTQNGKVPYKGTTLYDAKTVIKNNTITAKYTGYLDTIIGIRVTGRNIPENTVNPVDGGTIPAGDYYVSGLEITDNTIKVAGYGIVLQNARNCNISRNTITGSGYNSSDANVKAVRYHGIFLSQESTGNKLSENTIKNMLSNGIHFQSESGASEITSNTITAPGRDGLSVFAGSVVTGNIAGNVISQSGEHGISLSESVVRGSVYNNKITKAKKTGINIYTSATVSGNINNNTISTSSTNGINVGNGSKVQGNITANTVSDSGKSGIQLMDKSSVTGNIITNTITGSTSYGICVSDSSKLSGNISDNKVSKSGKTGIQVASKSSVLGNISGNVVSDSKVNGICAIGNSVVGGSIIKNQITNSGKNGINIYDSGEVSGSIKNNTISASTTYGICVGNSSAVKGNIDSNKISSSKKNGIHVALKSIIGKKIVSNTVSSSTGNGIAVMSSSKVKKGIEKNTIKKAKKYGIYVYDKSTVKPGVTENTIISCDTPIVVAPTCSVAVRRNTLSKNKNNYIRIITTKIKVKSIKTPKFSSTSGKGKKISMKWKKVKDISGYCVELSTTADFKKVSKTIDTTSRKGEFKKLKKGKTYYIRIRAYKESGKARIYGNYSKVKKIKVS